LRDGVRGGVPAIHRRRCIRIETGQRYLIGACARRVWHQPAFGFMIARQDKGEAHMRFGFLLSVALATALAVPALAQSGSYTWTGYGRGGGVGGSSNCSSYKMKVDVTVAGADVKGLFQQEGRPQRNFQATADASGNFRTKAQVQGGTMDVRGTINASTATVVLDGYCKFEAKLKKV